MDYHIGRGLLTPLNQRRAYTGRIILVGANYSTVVRLGLFAYTSACTQRSVHIKCGIHTSMWRAHCSANVTYGLRASIVAFAHLSTIIGDGLPKSPLGCEQRSNEIRHAFSYLVWPSQRSADVGSDLPAWPLCFTYGLPTSPLAYTR